MLRYLVLRLVQGVAVLGIVSIVAFGLVELVPGDPTSGRIGSEIVSQEYIDGIREELALDDPVHIRYAVWVENLLQGDLGRSTRTREPVANEVKQRLPATLHLLVGGVVVGVLFGVLAGAVAANWSGTFLDRTVTIWAILGVATPSFVVAVLAIFVFAVELGWVPATGYEPIWDDPVLSMRHLALPWAILGWDIAGVLARFTRSSMLEVLREDYIRTARAKGLRERRVVLTHALRNGMLPVVTVLGLIVGRLLAGSVVIETIFSIPGMGRYLIAGVNNSDYTVVQAVVLLSAVSIVGVSIIADLAYVKLDPRIRLGARMS
jgi:peptide/nickel transport system permease protein